MKQKEGSIGCKLVIEVECAADSNQCRIIVLHLIQEPSVPCKTQPFQKLPTRKAAPG